MSRQSRRSATHFTTRAGRNIPAPGATMPAPELGRYSPSPMLGRGQPAPELGRNSSRPPSWAAPAGP